MARMFMTLVRAFVFILRAPFASPVGRAPLVTVFFPPSRAHIGRMIISFHGGPLAMIFFPLHRAPSVRELLWVHGAPAVISFFAVHRTPFVNAFSPVPRALVRALFPVHWTPFPSWGRGVLQPQIRYQKRIISYVGFMSSGLIIIQSYMVWRNLLDRKICRIQKSIDTRNSLRL